MALFRGAKRQDDKRTFSRLVVSHGFSPAEQWMVDPELDGLFEYHWGGHGDTKVVIPKGRVVGVRDDAKRENPDLGKERTILTLPEKANKTIGVSMYNIYENMDSEFFGNQPAVITRDYIEVPMFADDPGSANENNKIFSAAFASGEGSDLNPGDYVKYTNEGYFEKIEPSSVSDMLEVVGQVLATDTDLPPHGWLKWLDHEEEEGERADDQSYLPYPDKDGRIYSPYYKDPYTRDASGIEGLTDGERIGESTAEDEEEDKNGTTYKSIVDDAHTNDVPTVLFRLQNAQLFENTVEITVEYADANDPDVELKEEDGDVHVDLENGVVYVEMSKIPEEGSEEDSAVDAVKVTYNYKDPDYIGVPTAWDFKDAVGAARILLKF